MKKKIYRATETDEEQLGLIVQFAQTYYITERAQRPELKGTEIPNEASVVRALIRAMYPVAAGAIASQLASLRGDDPIPLPQVDVEALMFRLFEDGHL